MPGLLHHLAPTQCAVSRAGRLGPSAHPGPGPPPAGRHQPGRPEPRSWGTGQDAQSERGRDAPPAPLRCSPVLPMPPKEPPLPVHEGRRVSVWQYFFFLPRGVKQQWGVPVVAQW